MFIAKCILKIKMLVDELLATSCSLTKDEKLMSLLSELNENFDMCS